jgi:hypothetical protein
MSCFTFTAPKSHVQQSSQGKSLSRHVDDNRESERRQEEMDKLKKQIDKYKDIVKQQEQLIQVLDYICKYIPGNKIGTHSILPQFDMTTTEILNFIWTMVRTTCSQPATAGTSSAPRMAKFTSKSN